MPRNSSGTYSTPAGQPVVSGTVISATVQNALVSDLSTEITNSLDRSGRGAMTGPMRVPDGTVAAPAVSFSSETGSGLYRSAAGVVRMAILGVYRMLWNATGAIINGTLEVIGDLAADGNINLATGSAQGINKSGAALVVGTTDANELQFWTGGAKRAAFGATGDLTFQSKQIKGLADPASAQDAATKAYVDEADWNQVFKTDADQTDSVGSATNITNMSFAVAASGVYVWQILGAGDVVGSSSLLRLQYTGPSAPTRVTYDAGSTYAAAFSTLATAITSGGGGTTTATIRSSGVLVNGANAGTVQLQFQWNGLGTSATVYKGMSLRWKKIA